MLTLSKTDKKNEAPEMIAAREEEAEKGFAVVADEVKNNCDKQVSYGQK